MREDRRRRYDDGFRREALELIKAGAGKDTLARRLAIPVYTARNWIRLYRSNGEEAVMGGGGVLLQFFLSNFCTIFPQHRLSVPSRNCTV